MAISIDPGFSQDVQDYGMAWQAGSGRWRRSFWSQDKEQETEREENMVHRLYQL